MPLLEANKLDLGLATGEVTYEAINGIGQPRAANLRIINATYSQSGMFMVRAESPYRSIADLKGKTVVWGAGSSGFIVLARYVMDGLGLDLERDFKAVFLDKAGDGPPMVLDGRAAAMWGGGVGWPPFVAIAKNPGGARFVAPGADEIKRIMAKHRSYDRACGQLPRRRADRIRRVVALRFGAGYCGGCGIPWRGAARGERRSENASPRRGNPH